MSRHHLIDPKDPLHQLLERDRRYRFEAYEFVIEGLECAQRKVFSEAAASVADDADEADIEDAFHVTGQQLCQAIRDLALSLYGMTAICVLRHWGIRSTRDIGEIVFNMIEIEKMKKTDRDRIEDFDDVFEFDQAFRPAFHETMPQSGEGHWA